MNKFKFEMGHKAKDMVTGFKGIITARAQYITGCDQYFLQPEMKKDHLADGKWYDENRLGVGLCPVITLNTETIVGGPHDSIEQAPSK